VAQTAVKLDLVVNLKYQSSTMNGIKYSVRNLFCDVNNYVWPTK